MRLLRTDRFPALLLLIAAAAGLAIANSPLADAVFATRDLHVGVPGILDLSLGRWISDGLLAVFFFVAAVELQFELTSGELNSPRRAIQPAIAAAGGVIVPIVVYLVVAGGASPQGWPIPTATDIAFALGVLAVFGRGLPSGVRIFLLALAILDDIVGIVFIAVLFTTGIQVLPLALAVVALVAFRLLSRLLDTRARRWAAVGMVVVALLTWWLVHLSGVHATIAGVGLGLVMLQQPALRTRYVLQPWVNGVVLPLFAFSAALVAIPQVGGTGLAPAFWGVAVALPLGKIIGITAAGWLAQRIGARGIGARADRGGAPASPALSLPDLIAAGALGGIGFTVSLLLSELAFGGDGALRDQATLGVLSGSALSLILAAILVSWRAWHHRRRATTASTTP